MSNKQDNNPEEPFSLNHFDEQNNSEEPRFDDALFSDKDTHAPDMDHYQGADASASPFTDPDPFDNSGDITAPDPIVPAREDSFPFASDDDIADPEPLPERPEVDEQTPVTPPHETSSTTEDDVQRRGLSPIAILAVLAILAAAVAAWLYPDASDQQSRSIEQQEPAFGTEIQLKRLQARISELEQQLDVQREQYEQRIAQLQQHNTEKPVPATQMAPHPINATDKVSKPVRVSHPATQPRVKKPAVRAAASKSRIKPAASWSVVLLSLTSKAAAEKAAARYKQKGIHAEIAPASVKGRQWYRLRVGGFATREEAAAQKSYLVSKYGMKDLWIQKP